ncbi:MAG TPA: cytochrome-c peroxidase [Nitrospirae bacterium]|nr:cytochrome-c peroxidase [Nitrospirota bacterium]
MKRVLLAFALILFPTTIYAENIPPQREKLQFQDFTLELPLGLEADRFYVPDDNQISADKVELGRALFFDPRLSADDSVACAFCHVAEDTFTDNLPTSIGIEGQKGGRNAPSIINRAFSREQFWDGRAASLEEQAKGPLTNPVEMGMPSHDAVVKKISAIKGYREWFKRVFGNEVNIDDLAKAIATFERTVVSGGSKMDRFTFGDKSALSASEKRGFELFEGKARCVQCHNGFNFTDEQYHNIGVGWDTGKVDLGRYTVTKRREHIGAFKTPSLREITTTDPYMHNGSIETLEEVIEFYNRGGVGNPFLDIEMKRPSASLEEMLDALDRIEGLVKLESDEGAALNLTRRDKADLLAFLKTLDGKGWRKIEEPDSFPK